MLEHKVKKIPKEAIHINIQIPFYDPVLGLGPTLPLTIVDHTLNS